MPKKGFVLKKFLRWSVVLSFSTLTNIVFLSSLSADTAVLNSGTHLKRLLQADQQLSRGYSNLSIRNWNNLLIDVSTPEFIRALAEGKKQRVFNEHGKFSSSLNAFSKSLRKYKSDTIELSLNGQPLKFTVNRNDDLLPRTSLKTSGLFYHLPNMPLFVAEKIQLSHQIKSYYDDTWSNKIGIGVWVPNSTNFISTSVHQYLTFKHRNQNTFASTKFQLAKPGGKIRYSTFMEFNEYRKVDLALGESDFTNIGGSVSTNFASVDCSIGFNFERHSKNRSNVSVRTFRCDKALPIYNAAISIATTSNSFDKAQFPFQTARNDVQSQLSLRFPLRFFGKMLNLKLSLVANDSNIKVYSYEQRSIELEFNF